MDHIPHPENQGAAGPPHQAPAATIRERLRQMPLDFLSIVSCLQEFSNEDDGTLDPINFVQHVGATLDLGYIGLLNPSDREAKRTSAMLSGLVKSAFRQFERDGPAIQQLLENYLKVDHSPLLQVTDDHSRRGLLEALFSADYAQMPKDPAPIPQRTTPDGAGVTEPLLDPKLEFVYSELARAYGQSLKLGAIALPACDYIIRFIKAPAKPETAGNLFPVIKKVAKAAGELVIRERYYRYRGHHPGGSEGPLNAGELLIWQTLIGAVAEVDGFVGIGLARDYHNLRFFVLPTGTRLESARKEGGRLIRPGLDYLLFAPDQDEGGYFVQIKANATQADVKAYKRCIVIDGMTDLLNVVHSPKGPRHVPGNATVAVINQHHGKYIDQTWDTPHHGRIDFATRRPSKAESKKVLSSVADQVAKRMYRHAPELFKKSPYGEA